MKHKHMKVRLEKVKRTDLICVACGDFRTDWAIVPGPGAEPQAGVHSRCIQHMHVRHTRKKSEAPESGELPVSKDSLDDDAKAAAQ
jgi:hypothetical protein